MNTPLFILNLVVLVVVLSATIISGRRGRRALHYRLVASTFVLLVLAIVQAELYGRGWDFNPRSLGIHLSLAEISLVHVPVVVWSGIVRARGGSIRFHRYTVASFVSFVLASVVTAVWIFTDATKAV